MTTAPLHPPSVLREVPNEVALRTETLLQAQQQSQYERTDRIFAVLMVVQLAAGILTTLFISPFTWSGASSSPHIHLWAAILLGSAITLHPVFLAVRRPGHTSTRHSIAVGQMLMSSLLIHLSGGRIETHFHIFGSLAFLAFYRDRKVLISATIVVVLDHVVRGIVFPQSIYGVISAPLWRSLEHAGWVLFELSFLWVAIRHSQREMWTIADRQARMEDARQGVEQRVLDRTSELELAEARTRSILETAADGIMTVDPKGIIESFNPAAEGIFRCSADRVIGQCVSNLFPQSEEDAEAWSFDDWLEDHDQGCGGCSREVVGLREDDSEFPLDLAISVSSGGNSTVIMRDITERKAIDRMKTDFISTVSHELRTPLTSIRGSLGLLVGGVAGPLPEQAQSLLSIALNNGERLVRLVNDILDIEKIESGKMEFNKEAHSLLELVQSAVEANRAYGAELDVQFELVAGEDPHPVWVDSDRIVQVLTNLLSNAAKFSPPGEVVTIGLKTSDRGPRVEICDRGSGIPEEFRERIFGKFAQADSSDTKQKQGTGLGLSICKAIIDNHSGEIGFESEPGSTVFFFELSHAPAACLTRPSEGANAPGVGEAGRILVCEDDPDIARLLALLLEGRRYAVDAVPSAQAALKALATTHYDAMTLDLMLPGTSGLELLRQLRESEEHAKLPVVIVSAKAKEGRNELEGDAFGVTDWLEKPINEPRLLSALNTALSLHGPSLIPSPDAKVLHVEDDPDVRAVVSGLLSPVAPVVPAPNIKTAAKLLEEKSFACVLLDVDLPDGSGLDLLPLIRETHPPAQVVIFSAVEPSLTVLGQVNAALVKSRTRNDELLETISSLIQVAPPVIEQEPVRDGA